MKYIEKMEITTKKELQEYIGQFLAFETTQYGIKTVWIKKLTSITNTYSDSVVGYHGKFIGQTEVDHLKTYGLFTAEVYPRERIYSHSKQPYSTNAQQIIRIPTKEEMNKYRNVWRHYRIFGTVKPKTT